MMEEFSRTEHLLGKEGMDRLRNSRILIFGAGGVGSHCIDALARSGVGNLFIVDNDTVAVSNINRQSVAFHHTVGRRKTEVIKEQILDIYPACRVFTSNAFILPENLEEIMEEAKTALGNTPDYIIDAIDTVAAKLALAEYAYAHRIPLISSMGTGNKLHPEQFAFADIYQTSVCPLCRVMRRELKKRGVPSLEVLYSTEIPLTPQPAPEDEPKNASGRPAPGSVSFVPPVAGLLIAGKVIRQICGC